MNRFILLFVIMSWPHISFAQQEGRTLVSDAVVTNSFWDNWYGQVGINMDLQFPYGHDMMDVFPNGKSFGINAAVGKWFTTELGGRFKITWGNGILKNDHNQWLRPYGEPGKNHQNGGYITFIGDIQFNLHNLFGHYDANRKWNIILAPRAGGWIDVGGGDGAPVLGVGVINTYRLSDRCRLFADVGFHFMASLNSLDASGEHGGDGFGEINLGLEIDLSKENKFHKSSDNVNKAGVQLNSIWDNWFIQAGLGMSLQNPYGTNFVTNLYPNGNTFGVNIGLGKWFSPDVGLRVGGNWQNGIIGNAHAYNLDKEGDPGSNKRKHGFVAVYGDLFFNLHHIFCGYKVDRKWNAIIFPRMGIARNFASGFGECPILGVGTENTYKLNKKTKLFADLAYQVVTGGFVDGKYKTGSTGSNGWFDVNVGVQYELGRNTWLGPGEKREIVYWEGGHNWPRFVVNTSASVIVAFGAKTVLKKVVHEERPDHSDNKSFPSGHASMAFAAARSIDKEFRKDCIWIPIAGYAAATAIGVERVVNDHHHWYDVVAGAALGFGSAELTWWVSDMLFPNNNNVGVGVMGNGVDVVVKL